MTDNNSPVTVPTAPSARVFKYERLSASMLKTFLSCRRKFHENYILGHKSDPNTSFSLGTAVHYALEQANHSLKDTPRQLAPEEVEEYVQIFREKAAQSHILSIDTFNVGEALVRSELETYPVNERVIGVELEFDLVTPEGVRIYGFMDNVVEVDSRTIKVVDYKTSLNPLSFEDAKIDEQLAMYDLAISMIFPQYQNRKLQLRYLRSGEDVTVVRTAAQQYAFRMELLAVHKAILEYMANVPAQPPAGEVNDFCNWCSYKSSCPQYAQMLGRALPDFPSISSLTDDSFVDMWNKVNGTLSALEKLKDDLKLWVAQRYEQDPDALVSNGEKEMYSVSTVRREYDVETVLRNLSVDELLGNGNGTPLVKISSKNLEGFLKEKKDRQLKNLIESSAIVKFNTPFFKVRKAKKGK